MILRKPYGFLIKHFKLIHLIMTIFMGILIYQTNLLLEFFNDFVGSQQVIVGNEVVGFLFNNYSYLFSMIIVLMSAVIFILMSFKDKPRVYYILNIVGYTLLVILYVYGVSTINKMPVVLVDERITRAIRDFFNIIFVFQIYSLFICLIRSIGLDVKKFDFNQDVYELYVTDQDREEFEVNVEFDSHTLKRKLRRNYRNLKYYFVENKITLLMIFGIIVVISGISITIGLLKNDVSYKVGDVFSPINYNIAILDSYITDNDYRANKISKEDESLVVVKFKIKTSNKTSKFIFGKLALQIDKNKFYHTNIYASRLTDIGDTYISQNLSDEYQEFLLVYEIPSHLKNKSMKMIYTDQIVEGVFKDTTDDIKVQINPIDLDKSDIEENININKNYVIGTGLLEGHELKVNSFDIQNSFKIYYNKCVSKNECYKFYEIVKPSLSGINDKAVLKLNLSLIVPDNSKNNVKSLITQFGNIEYEINGVDKVSTINKMLNTTRNDGNYYFVIKDEILKSNNVSLVIRVRNDIYRFKLK